jgi:hypothetical protein
MKRYLLVMWLVLLCSCATQAKYQAVCNSWLGSSEESLISSWGIPNGGSYSTDSTKYLTYINSSNIVIPGQAPTYQTTIYGNTAYTTQYGGSAPTTVNFHCTTTFTVKDGVISNYSFRGNNCVSN